MCERFRTDPGIFKGSRPGKSHHWNVGGPPGVDIGTFISLIQHDASDQLPSQVNIRVAAKFGMLMS